MREAQKHIDQLGRRIELKDEPLRIVSLVPSQTELLYHLGLDESVVGITKFCVHPKEWHQSKTRVGGTKHVNIEIVSALKPNLIIANKEENTKIDIEKLEKIAPVWISDVRSLSSAYAMILAIGSLVGRSEKAFELVQEIKSTFLELKKPQFSKKVAYVIWKDPLMLAGGDTFIHAILEELGFINVAGYLKRYPEVTLSGLSTMNPDMILLSSEPYPFKEKDKFLFQQVLPNARIQLVDGELFSWYGSRLLNIKHIEDEFLEF